MVDRNYLLRQAMTLLRLARVSDPPVAGTLAVKIADLKDTLESDAVPQRFLGTDPRSESETSGA